MEAQIIDLVSRHKPNLRHRERALTQEAEQILQRLESVLGQHAMVGAAICGRDPDAMNDELACRHMAAHTAGMLEAYAQRHRQAQRTFEEALRRKGKWPPS